MCDFNDDNTKLLELQNRFLDGDLSAWSELWKLSFLVCKRIILHEQKKKGFFINQDDCDDKALNAVEYVLRRYKKTYKNGSKYRVKSNFISVLHFGVIHSLYYKTENDKVFDNAYLFSDLIEKFKVIDFNVDS